MCVCVFLHSQSVQPGGKNLPDTLKGIAPDLPESTMQVINGIVSNSTVAPTGRRWERGVLRFALNIWSLSPKAYQDMSDTLKLPSVRLLQYYKNIIHQKSGFLDEVFQWMLDTADQKGVPQSGRRGGIVFDEMAIQQDLQLDSRENQANLVGAVDLGTTAKHMDIIRHQASKKVLATHALQFEFLGHSGFMFPFGHFASPGAQAYHLIDLFWKSVSKLLEYGFHVDFCLFDGASANRSFLKSMFYPSQPLQGQNFRMSVPNIMVPGARIVLGMDIKHVIKRLRNNAYSSGDSPEHTRKLKWKDCFIVWEHWEKAVMWDMTENPEMNRIHHKLTKEHLNLSCSTKMRNHLAEDCLNSSMLHLMELYARSLSNGDHLRGTIEFLRHTSQLVSFSQDNRNVTDAGDSRLVQLLEVSE